MFDAFSDKIILDSFCCIVPFLVFLHVWINFGSQANELWEHRMLHLWIYRWLSYLFYQKIGNFQDICCYWIHLIGPKVSIKVFCFYLICLTVSVWIITWPCHGICSLCSCSNEFDIDSVSDISIVLRKTLLFVSLKKSFSNELLAAVRFCVLKSIYCFNQADCLY